MGEGLGCHLQLRQYMYDQFQRFMKNKLQLFLNQDYPARIKLDTNTESKLSKNYLEDVLCTFHGLAKQWKNSNMEID